MPNAQSERRLAAERSTRERMKERVAAWWETREQCDEPEDEGNPLNTILKILKQQLPAGAVVEVQNMGPIGGFVPGQGGQDPQCMSCRYGRMIQAGQLPMPARQDIERVAVEVAEGLRNKAIEEAEERARLGTVGPSTAKH